MGQLNQAIKIKNVLKFYDIKNFVETGTGIGEVVRSVCEIDQNINIHTIEIIEEIYDKNKISLSYLDNVNWHLGQSSDVLPDIVPSLQGSTLFWMDAHFPGADFGLAEYGDEKNIDKRLPLKSELEIIVKNKDVSNDVFIIDDLRIYEDGPFEAGVWKDRSKYGGDGIEFIEELFEETHYVVKSYNQQGYIMLFPVNKDIEEEASNLVVGSVE
jgi:hypothetical protein|tara:strand:- start:1873 stop:2511 length:639 start_codon:yes stop_codon:yes gene_type:complete